MSGLALDLGRALDPIVLAREVGMQPDDWQALVLRSRARRLLLNCCRQSGKTTVAAILALHTALYQASALILIISGSERQAKELYRTALVAYRTIGRPVSPEAENALSLELENRSRIIVVPASAGTIRGYAAVTLLLVDEAAQVPDETFMTIRPMLAVSQGRLVLMSTPFGRRGFFWEAWRSEEPWERYLITAAQCPRISPEFLDEERRTTGEWWHRQEFWCEFQDAQSSAFRESDVAAMFDAEVVPWSL